VSASVDTESVASSMRALQAGALTLLSKPVSPAADDFEEITRQFVGTVRAMADVKVVRRYRSGQTLPPPPRRASNGALRELHGRPRPRIRVIGIAASTGGPAALQRVLSDMPPELPVPVLVVQHIAHGFVHGLASWLSAVTPFQVTVAEHGEIPQPGRVYVAPDDRHLAMTHAGTIDLSRTAAIGGFVPSGTVLFASLAESHGASALGLIMTGMGQDGVDGLRNLHRTGAMVLAQDEESSVVFGMPGATVDAGLADAVVPLSAIGSRLFQLVRVEE
jgi:two-component system chemotaxis response regulator CheB